VPTAPTVAPWIALHSQPGMAAGAAMLNTISDNSATPADRACPERRYPLGSVYRNGLLVT